MMKVEYTIVEPGFEFIPPPEPGKELEFLEVCTRTCYEPGTEVLTVMGWMKIEKIDPNLQVLTYNPIAKSMQYEKANTVCMEHDGELIESSHQSIPFSVTPYHRMYATKSYDQNGERYRFVEAKELLSENRNNGFRIPKWFPNINDRHLFRYAPDRIEMLPVIIEDSLKRRRTLPGKILPLDNNFIVLLGAFVAEGHIREATGTGAGITITQGEKELLYTKVIEALENLGLPYNITSDPRKPHIKRIAVGGGIPLKEWFKKECGHNSHHKHLPWFFRHLDDKKLQLLLDVLYMGDGSGNTTRTEKYLTVSQLLRDQIQEIHILLGKNASTGSMNHETWTSECFYVEESQRHSWIIRPDHLKVKKYKGKVYCTSTDTGIICVRRNGQAIWCGNCYKSEDHIKPGSAEKLLTKVVKGYNHLSVTEHANCVIGLGRGYNIRDFRYNPLLRISERSDGRIIVSGNLRMWMEFSKEAPKGALYEDIRHLLQRKWPFFFEKPEMPYHGFASLLDENPTTNKDHLTKEEMLKHMTLTYRIIGDRSMSHQLVRHRLCAFSQESQRYCDYGKKGLQFVVPPSVQELGMEKHFINEVLNQYSAYNEMISFGIKPEDARGLLPNCTKTEVVTTCTLENWGHIFRHRGHNKHAQKQIRDIMLGIEADMKSRLGWSPLEV